MGVFILAKIGRVVKYLYPGGSDGKESACNAGDLSSIPGVGKIPWRTEWQPTPVFFSGKFHGQATVHGVAKS